MKNTVLYFLIAIFSLMSCRKEEMIDFDGNVDPVYGTVSWSDGTPAAGIQVSDGFTVTRTDASGRYSIEKRNVYAQWVYYTIPADAKVETGENGLPCFYRKLSPATSQYDFTLTKTAVEKKFRLLALGDLEERRLGDVDVSGLDQLHRI